MAPCYSDQARNGARSESNRVCPKTSRKASQEKIGALDRVLNRSRPILARQQISFIHPRFKIGGMQGVVDAAYPVAVFFA